MTDWPPVTIIVGGDGTTPAARHTVASLAHTRYEGELQVLTGDEGEPGSPAEVSNDHVGEARGDYIMMIPPGTTLDPHCIRYLVERALAHPDTVAVALQWRASDGTVLEAGSHLRSSDEISPLFHGAELPEWLGKAPYPTAVSSRPSLFVRARDFFVVGGFNLALDGSPYQAAHFALSLTSGGGRIEVETKAVAFGPASPEPAPGQLVHGRNTLQADFSDVLDQLHYQSSIDADMSVLLGDQLGSRTLWAALHLPDATRSGADARHLQMIEALIAGDDEVVVWSTHTDGSDSGALDQRGIRWVAQPPAHRWDLTHDDGLFPWLEELMRQLHWDHIVIADPTLVPRIAPLVRRLSSDTAIIADLGSVRFPAAHNPTPGTEPTSDLPALDHVDGVVAATAVDLSSLLHHHPEIPASTFAAMSHPTDSSPDPAGGLLFIGNLLHRPNAEAVSWWIEALAGRVEARLGTPTPLRVVGNGADLFGQVWNHPTKVEIAGWQPDLAVELAAARLFLVPLPYATGTGGRIAAAVAHGVPTVVSRPAATMLAPEIRALVHVGETADELADHVARLMTNDDEWRESVDQLRAANVSPTAQSKQFVEWVAGLTVEAPPVAV